MNPGPRALPAVLILGGHCRYARVPPGFWIQDWFDFSRNHDDRIGHLVQGDPWDTQWDMFLADCGAIGARFLFERLHDQRIAVVDPAVADQVRPRA